MANMAELFPKNLSLSLEHNEHKNYYDDIGDFINSLKYNDEDFVSLEEKQRCIDTDEIWVLQYYPNTPVGYNLIIASTLDAILEQVQKDKDND